MAYFHLNLLFLAHCPIWLYQENLLWKENNVHFNRLSFDTNFATKIQQNVGNGKCQKKKFSTNASKINFKRSHTLRFVDIFVVGAWLKTDSAVKFRWSLKKLDDKSFTRPDSPSQDQGFASYEALGSDQEAEAKVKRKQLSRSSIQELRRVEPTGQCHLRGCLCAAVI